MKKSFITLMILAGFAMQALAYDFQSGNLLYTIISTDPPRVSLDGHIDGAAAQGGLIIPEAVDYEGVVFSVTRIGCAAFQGCRELSGQLVIPSMIDTIQTSAFSGCSGFTGDLILPDEVKYLGARAFEGCLGFDGQLSLPESITAILPCTFKGCFGLKGTLDIPHSVTHIYAEAFCGCSGFTGDLVIPNSVTELSQGSPSANTVLGAFQDCTGFDGRLVLSDALEVIHDNSGGGCFAGCHHLTGTLELPKTLKRIGEAAFANCSGLVGTLEFPDSLNYIGIDAFSYCSGFSGRLVFPEAVEWVGDYAFVGCGGITEVDLHHQAFYQNNYGMAVFMGCGLIEIDVPEGWTAINDNTFANNRNLTRVQLPESLVRIGSASFRGCVSLSEINIPQNVVSVGIAAFSRCLSLKELRLSDAVERVELHTFDSCVYLNKVVLGKSVSFVAEPAFRNTHLESLVMRATTPPELKFIVNQTNLPFDLPVVVPCGTLEAYENADGWSNFTSIKEGNTYCFSAISENSEIGTVIVLKEAVCGDMMVEVEAVPTTGNEFLYWEANGEMVSMDNPYGFVLEEDTKLVARFSGAGLEESEQKVVFYPNPAHSVVKIEGMDVAEVKVYNALGQMVKVSKQSNDLNLEGLPNGIYALRFVGKNGERLVERVVKE